MVDARLIDTQVHLGASWYPEMWPEEEWPRDVARMKEIGFTMVRMFEFAWHRFEPEEGRYDFDWAVKVMDLCAEAGIAVMVGTPTAAPPAWLTEKYPEVLRVREDGTRATHGGRCHYNMHSEKYRELIGKLVTRMVDAFRDHPALHSWQIDNEMGGTDYSDETVDKFHKWLEARYGTAENLNSTWGLEFWSQAYNSFDQVPLPGIGVGKKHHCSLVLAAAQFQMDGWSEFIKFQCDLIREWSDKPITSNMVGGGLGHMNWFQHNRLFDRVSTSMYKDVDHYHWNIMHLDRMRAEKPGRPYWHLETAPNWSGGTNIWNIHHSAAGIRAMTWKSILLGGSMMLYWQWRQHWAGQEMLHGTLVTATGKWRPNKEAIAQMADEYAKHGQWLLDNPPQQAEVALVVGSEADWAFTIAPMDDLKYVERVRDDHYLPLFRQHTWRDVIHQSADFSRYKVIIIPMMPILTADTRKRLKEWVEAGGKLLIGPMTGFRSEEFTVFTDHEFGGLEELMGAESSLRFTAHWVEDTVKVVFDDGMTSRTKSTCEGFTPTAGKPLARYEGGYGDGHVAIVRHDVGQGTVITQGCLLDANCYLRLVNTLCREAGIEPVAHGTDDVVVVPRARDGKITGYGIVNITERPQEVALPVSGTDLLSGQAVDRVLKLEPLAVKAVVV